MQLLLFVIAYIFIQSFFITKSEDVCSGIIDNERFDCHPDTGASKERCLARGCCWALPTTRIAKPVNVSYCFFSKKPPSYRMISIDNTAYGYKVFLKTQVPSPCPQEISNLVLDIWFEDIYRIRFKIYDPKIARYEVPIDIKPPSGNSSIKSNYDIQFFSDPFSFRIIRIATGAVLFDTKINTAPFIFSNQFIQISTRLSTELVYGLGEHRTSLLKNASQWQRHVFWNTDVPPKVDQVLYGSHAFYLNMEADHKAHGVFLVNSNAMEVDLQSLPALTFRTIGGILDFFVLTGETPLDVIKQYSEIVGQSPMPPFWALGFHLCRWGYTNTTILQKIIDRNRAIGIPYDVQWNDIDYMDKMKDFTLSNSGYQNVATVVQNIHDHGQKYMMIVDPAISAEHAGSYPPYDRGVKMNAFVKNVNGSNAIGKVWPGKTVFPDFTNKITHLWWSEQIQEFHRSLNFDSLWIDMNEPSNFIDGSYEGCLKNSSLDNPPYEPGNRILYFHTMCPSFVQAISSHYDVHNIYGLTEVIATRKALDELYKGKRSIIISRSSFPTLGKYGGHWSGDTESIWEDMYYSVIHIMEFQFYAIPLVGTDICGFSGDVTEELCVRWMQVGSFYPFMRNHNNLGNKDQDPASFSRQAQQIIKTALELRYSLLPYMYTQFYHHYTTGRPVVQPLFFSFPDDKTVYSIDKQFTWSNNLLISPILQKGETVVKAYLPQAMWYDLEGKLLNSSGQWYQFDAPLDKINVHFRAGHIFPFIMPAVTTTLMRDNQFTLLVALDESGFAEGNLYWDDGESIDSLEKRNYDLIYFICSKSSLKSILINDLYKPANGLPLDEVIILGFPRNPNRVVLNGSPVIFNYKPDLKQLVIETASVSMIKPFEIKWD